MNDRKKKEEEIYMLIGKFAVEFEQICHTMENGIRCILELEGLKNERIHEILLSGLTAEPLGSLFRILCVEHIKPKPKTTESKIIISLFSSFQNLVSTRNDLIHGKWFLAFKSVDDKLDSVAYGNKLHKNANGSATKKFEYNVANFQGLYDQAYKSRSCFSKLTNCIAGKYPLEKNFLLDEVGKYKPVNGLCIE